MAKHPILVPGVGESITEGILARWLKATGSAVNKGDPLYELETDKASNVIPSPASGILRTTVTEGATVAIGAVIGEIDPDSKSTAAAPATPAPATSSSRASTVPPQTQPHAVTAPAAPIAHEQSPAVRRIAAETGVDLAQVPATGPGGRVTKGDVIEHLERTQTTASPVTAAAPAPADAPAPLVQPVIQQAPRGPRSETRARMSGIRQRIAARLVEAQHTAAILTTFNEADLSAVIALRAKYKESFQKKHGVGLGFMGFFVKAAIAALKAFPNVNSRIEGAEIVTPAYYDIGVAVSTDRGLMVPVLRDADQLTFAGIEQAIADYARKARENAIAVSDLQGGTFTITNGGIFGSLLSTPILNPPQSGILGMHKIQERPVALEGQVVIRPMMYLALSYDHRIIDGREAVSFLVKIKECLESPERLMLEV
jgi:2-oxoglutarate dehydrogenase E2 component (dihydrolipoamide succinyltransferase)